MSNAGTYLYGFTGAAFQPPAGLRGLAAAPVQLIGYRDVAAVVSRHPVQPLMPLRSNLEPHHRIVRHVSGEATLVPVAFGHISESDDEVREVLRDNYDEIRGELARLDRMCEMGVKLSWAVENIFEHLVQRDRPLRELRDRVFGHRQPSLNDRLQVGSAFAAALTRERERLTAILLRALEPIARDVFSSPARTEKTICQTALLVERRRLGEFTPAIERAAALFNADFNLQYSGPWAPYSFVRLRLQLAKPTAAA
jgi:hypothetical protein